MVPRFLKMSNFFLFQVLWIMGTLCLAESGTMIEEQVEDYKEFLEKVNQVSELNRKKRKITSDSRKRWPTNIPYTINGADVGAVERGLNAYRENTCLKFTKINNAETQDQIQFMRGSGCFSSVGRQGGRQDISIGIGCTKVGIVAHSIGHALGFWHEQARPDRDSFVRIMFNNIVSGTLGNFVKQPLASVSLKFPYDLGSVMHYGPKAFSRSGFKNTIETVDPNAQGTIGQLSGLSFYDIKTINDAYCSDVCRGSRLNCQHNGYPDPKNCNRCRCPEGFGGTNCERADRGTGNCGQTDLVAGNSFQTISASGGGNCYYHIKADEGEKVLIVVDQSEFDTETPCTNYLEIKHSSDLANTGPRMCTPGLPVGPITSQTNEAVVIKKGVGSFTLRYRQDPSGVTPGPTSRGTTPGTTSSSTATKPPRGWSNWGSWSRCSGTCGACGIQLRRRVCPGGFCAGPAGENRFCAFNACPTECNTRGTLNELCEDVRSCCGNFVNTEGTCGPDGVPLQVHSPADQLT